MQLDAVRQSLGLPELGEEWRSQWELAEHSFVPDKVFFLEPGFVAANCDQLKMKAGKKELFLKALELFRNNVPLQRLAWQGHHLITDGSAEMIEHAKKWPAMPKDIGADANMFYALVFLSRVPYAFALHGKRGIPESITVDTLSVLERSLEKPLDKLTGVLWWLIYFISGNIYKLGRLEHQLKDFRWDFHVFRNRQNRKVVTLAGDGMKFRADGQFEGTNGICDGNRGWTAGYENSQDFVRGNPVSPLGYALRKTVALKTSLWQEVLKNSDPTLALHIPATGPMSHSECGDSIKQAISFFAEHFPEFKYRAFRCSSWLLDGQLEQYLPAESNIVRFMREFYLFPVLDPGGNGIYSFVFGKQFDHIDEIPQNTTLEKAIVKHLRSGGKWRSAGCFMFPEDLKWGQQVYRRELSYFSPGAPVGDDVKT